MIETFFLGFPINMIWGVLLTRYYSKKTPAFLYWLGLIGLMGGSFFMPFHIALAFWLPGGAMTILSGTIAFLLFMNPKKFERSFQLRIKTRKDVKDRIAGVEDMDERRNIYFTAVKTIASLWRHKERAIAGKNSLFVFLLLLSVFAVDYVALIYLFQSKEALFKFLQSYSSQIPPELQLKLSEDALKELTDTLVSYSPIIVFVQNALTLWVLSFVVTRVQFARDKKDYTAPGYFSLFRLPEQFIYIFLALALTFVAVYYLHLDKIWSLVLQNFLLIAAFFYVMHGMSVVWTYLQIRLLPAGWFFAITIIFSLLIQEFLISIIFFSFFIGVADFWFNFRKKALHPTLADE